MKLNLSFTYSDTVRNGRIATRYGLDGPGIESRWGGARFYASVQTGPVAHPASC